MPANLSSLTRRSVPAVSAAAGAASLRPRHLPAADSAPRGQQSNRSQPEGLTRDDILDNITLYWLTKTGVFSARLSWKTSSTFSPPSTSRCRWP